MDQVQTVVVGAGIIGIAIARALARRGQEFLILEAEARVGLHSTSRNSGVVHAGIYYPNGSWRGLLCAVGKEMLYDYCTTRHLGVERTGKLIVALNSNHADRLPGLVETARGNGVDDLALISAADARGMEPEVDCRAAILSPSTGIVDVPGLVLSLSGEAEAEGAMLALNAPFVSARVVDAGLEVQIGDPARTRIGCRTLINAAGLGAWEVARGVRGLDTAHIPPQHFAKGCWYSGSGPAPFGRLIYPVPDDESLGVHFVRDLGGGFRFGPDLEWLDVPELDYTVDAGKQARFEASVRRFWPGLREGSLQPDSAGIRPRVSAGGTQPSDFVFSGPRAHGFAGLWQLFGFESPGMTCCLAIARHVAGLIGSA